MIKSRYGFIVSHHFQLMDFTKYHGTGNDFILVDDRQLCFPENAGLISSLCDRHYGIGADGLLLLREAGGFDFRMVYYNSDGSAATFCGNGGRCITAFARSLGLIGRECRFIAADGEHSARIMEEGAVESQVSLQMRDAVIYDHNPERFYLNSGTFHVVCFVENPADVDIIAEGRKIRYDERYAPHGTNVNFVKQQGDHLLVRTYEKGVEAETLSCGTGVVASAVAASLRDGGSAYNIKTAGGVLQVRFTSDRGQFSGIYLHGPATRVFSGKLSI